MGGQPLPDPSEPNGEETNLVAQVQISHAGGGSFGSIRQKGATPRLDEFESSNGVNQSTCAS